MKEYVWTPCCDTMKKALGQDKPRAIPEFHGKQPSGGRFEIALGLGLKSVSPRVLVIRHCPGCGKELMGERSGEVA